MKYSTIKNIIRRLTNAGRREIAREHLARVFQVNNRVRNVKTGVEYTVYEVDPDAQAYLESELGEVIMPSWLTASGQFRPEVAAIWELVPPHTATRLVAPVMAAGLGMAQGVRA